VYAGPLEGGDYTLVIVNWYTQDYNETFEIDLGELGLQVKEGERYLVRDLWMHAEVDDVFAGKTSIKVDRIPAYGSYSFRLIK
jgi:Alpha galactosidase C-terminal beta sandwich domain